MRATAASAATAAASQVAVSHADVDLLYAWPVGGFDWAASPGCSDVV